MQIEDANYDERMQAYMAWSRGGNDHCKMEEKWLTEERKRYVKENKWLGFMQVSYRGEKSTVIELFAVFYSGFVWPFFFLGLIFLAAYMLLFEGGWTSQNKRLLGASLWLHVAHEFSSKVLSS